MIFEVLRPHRPVSELGSRILVAQNPRRVRVVAGHERGPRRPTIGALAKGLGEPRPASRQTIDMGGLTDRVPVAGQRRRAQVVGNDEQHVESFRLKGPTGTHAEAQRHRNDPKS